MNRQEHLQWAKDRALEYVRIGDFKSAVASMGGDLREHPELKDHAGIDLGVMLLLSGHLSTEKAAREWVVGFR